jgi:hypothetical protein
VRATAFPKAPTLLPLPAQEERAPLTLLPSPNPSPGPNPKQEERELADLEASMAM